MKRNLLIGTSLVAAFATTSLSARAASAIDKASYDLTTDVAVAHRVAEKALASATVTGATPLKAGATPVTLLTATLGTEAGRKVLAGILKSTETDATTLASKFKGLKDKKAAVAEIAKALATNAELRKLVADFRPAVVKAVADEKALLGKKVEPVVVVPGVEVTLEALTLAVTDTANALVAAINAEGVAQKAVKDTTAELTAKTTAKETAEKELTAAQTAAQKAADAAASAKTAAEKATADLTGLTTEKKDKAEAIAEKEATAAETNALNELKAELALIETKIVSATAVETKTAAELAAADALVVTTKAAVATKTAAATDAATTLETAEKAKADAAAALTAKTAAVTEATTKLATEKDALLTAATTAATAAATKATAATEAAGTAELQKTELATAAESAKAKVIELGKRKTSLKAELTAARSADAAASTEATKAAIKAKEDAVIAITTELAQAEIAKTHAEQAAKAAVEAATKATADAVTATEAKTTADAALTTAKAAVKASDEAVKAAKAAVAQAAEKVEADALAAKTKADVKKADAAEAKAAEELAALEAKLTLDPTNKDLQDAVAAKKAELAELKTAAVEAATAAQAAEKAASDLAAKEAELATAALSAKALTDQLTAAQTAAAEATARVAALEDAGSKSAIEVSGLTADKVALTATVDGFNADLVVDSLIKRTEGELEAAQTAARAADNTFETLMAEITVLVKKDDAAAAATVSLAEALKDASLAQIRSDVVRMRDTQTAASEGYAKALAAANTLTDETAKAAAIAKLGDAPAVDARLEQLIAAIDAYVAADLDVKAAHSFLDTASRLRHLMQQATVEGAGTLSGKLAARLNANIAAAKAQLVADLNRTGRPVGFVVAEAVEEFNVLAREAEQFNELKTLFDIDAKLNAKDDAVTAQLKRIVAELQSTLDSSVTADVVARTEKLVAAMTKRLEESSRGFERFAGVEGSKSYGDAPRRAALIVDAAAHLETLQRALRDASDVTTGTIEGLMSQLAQAKELSDHFAELTQREAAEKARFAGLTDADKADKRVEKEHKDELSDLEARKGRLVDDAADLERKDDGHGRVENLTADAVAQLQNALFEYDAFLAELEKASDFDLVDADTIDRVFSTKTDGAGSSKAGFDAFKARVGQAVPFASKDIDTVSRQFAASVERKERELATQSRVLGEKLDAAVRAFETEYRAVAAAAPSIALDAFEFLQREVPDRQSDIVRLTAHNAELATAKAQAADTADQVRIQGQIDSNAREIAELTTWFADNAANIAAATAEAGKLATLDAEVTALRAQSTALRADFAKTSEERAADTRALQTLTRAVHQARAVKVEENGAFVADLEAAVETILSPAPVVVAAPVAEFEEDEEGAEEDEEGIEEGANGETTGTGGAQSASTPLPTGGEFGSLAGTTDTAPRSPLRSTTVGFDAPGASTSATDGTTTTTAGGYMSPARQATLSALAAAQAANDDVAGTDDL